MDNKKTYLTYNTITENDLHRGVLLDHRGLNGCQIQEAIDEYIVNQSEKSKELKRLSKLVDELLVERNAYKKFYDREFHRRNSGN